MKAGAKMSNITFIDFDICHRMEPLQKSYYVTLKYIFKLKITNSNQPVPADLSPLVRPCRGVALVRLYVYSLSCKEYYF